MFVTWYAYEMRSSTFTACWSAAGSTVAVLVSATAGADAIAGTVIVDTGEGSLCAPCVSTPVAVAASVAPPASTSSCVTVYGLSAVHVSDAPGASPGAVGGGHVTFPAVGSLTATEVSVMLPVFLTL
jgi:hypothetical protein